MDSSAPKNDIIAKIRVDLQNAQLAPELAEKLTNILDRTEKAINSTGYRLEFDKELEYVKFVSSLPFHKNSQDILDLIRTAQILNKNHYGLEVVKDRILEYLSILILNSRSGVKMKSSVLAFVGLVGSGKTSLAYSIAESLGRKIIRVPFGGLGSVRELRGESRINFDAEPGRILKVIAQLGVNNPIVLLDEIDRIAVESRNDIMGVLVELLDPEQNFAFVDRYVDYPFDLSNVLFIATANNLANVATAVMDRLEVIEMPSYTDVEKIVIGKNYILPKVEKESGLKGGTIIIEESLWPTIVRPLGYDAGIRSLSRHIQTIVRRVAKKVVQGNLGPFNLNTGNIGEYLS